MAFAFVVLAGLVSFSQERRQQNFFQSRYTSDCNENK